MAEGTYEYECMRAELLGIEKPDYEEFMRKKSEEASAQQEDLEAAGMKEEHAQNQRLFGATTRLDDLNNILKSTQQKINNFTAPFSRFVRSKIGKSVNNHHPEDHQQASDDGLPFEDVSLAPSPGGQTSGKSEPNHSLSLLDGMIEKCETAQFSMESQNKQMRRFMK